MAPYDSVPVAAAYGTRLLLSAYDGPLFRVRRYTDSTNIDVMPLENGDPDLAAIAAHLGANPGYISRLYDQVSGSNGLAQSGSNEGEHPLLVINEGKCWARFDGVDDIFVDGNYGLNIRSETTLIVGRATGDPEMVGTDFSRLRLSADSRWYHGYVEWRIGAEASVQYTGTYNDGVAHAFVLRADGDNKAAWVDGVAEGTSTDSNSEVHEFLFAGGGTTAIDTHLINHFNPLDIGEYVLAGEPWTTGQRETAEAAAAAYWMGGTPMLNVEFSWIGAI